MMIERTQEDTAKSSLFAEGKISFHAEPRQFHARYGESEAVDAFDTLDILRGQLPRRAHIMVIEWALAHRTELRSNWQRAREQLPLQQIEPLD